jgi:F0F1-type ATP synthase assembly protein I
MEMAFSVLAGTVFGYVLDATFETAPVLTIVFLFVGLVGGVVAFVKLWTLLREKM